MWDRNLQGASRWGRERYLGTYRSRLTARLVMVLFTWLLQAWESTGAVPQVTDLDSELYMGGWPGLTATAGCSLRTLAWTACARR